MGGFIMFGEMVWGSNTKRVGGRYSPVWGDSVAPEGACLAAGREALWKAILSLSKESA